MTAPRKNPDLVNAPVLFRLPNLHPLQDARAQQHAAAPWVSPIQPAAPVRPQPLDSAAAAYRSAPAAEVPYIFSANDTRSEAAQPQAAEIFTKRPVILLAMALVAGGGWFVGRQTAHHPTAQHPAQLEIAANTSRGDGGQHDPTAMTPAAGPRATVAAAGAAAAERSWAGKTPGSSLAAQDTNDFYLADDALEASPSAAAATVAVDDTAPRQSSAATAESDASAPGDAAGANDPASVFAAISLDALTAPANQTPPAHQASPANAEAATPTAEPAELTAQTPATADEQTVVKKVPDASTADTSTPAGDTEGAATDGAADAGSTVSSDGQSPKQRRVLSPTPNDIPDWSRYFLGGAAPVRSASAEGFIEQSDAPPTSRQAFYQDNAAGF